MASAAFIGALVWLSVQHPYYHERFEAIRAGVTAAELADADRLAARARAVPADLAKRLWREARWAVPAQDRDRPAHVVRVLGGARLRHAGRVNALSTTPSGKLVSVSTDGTARVWNLENGREVRQYLSHQRPEARVTDVFNIGAVAVRSGQPVATAGNGEVHLWSLTTGEAVRTAKSGDGANRGLAHSPDGRRLYVAGDSERLMVYDAATLTPLDEQPPSVGTRVEALSIDPAGRFVALGTNRGGLVVYPIKKDGACGPPATVAVAGGESGVLAAVVVPGTDAILTGANDGTLRLTGVSFTGGAVTTKLLKAYPAHPGRVTALAVLPGNDRFATGSSDGAVRVWDLAGGKLLALHPVAEPALPDGDGGVSALAVAADGSELAVGTALGAIKLVSLDRDRAGVVVAQSDKPVWALAGDGRSQVAAAGANRAVTVYDAATGKTVHTTPAGDAVVSAMDFVTPSELAFGGSGGRVRRGAPGADPKATSGHRGTVLAVAADRAGRVVYSGGIAGELVAESEGGAEQFRLKLPSAITALAAGDGRVVVGLADGSLALVESGAALDRQSAHSGGVSAVASRDGGEFYSAGGDGVLRAWRVKGDRLVAAGRVEPTATVSGSPPAAPLAAVAVSADGRLLAVAGGDGVVRVHTAADLAERESFRGHDGWASAVCFTPGGESVYSAGADGTVRRYELPALAAAGHAGPVTAVAVSPDGTRLATGSGDRTVKVWDRATGGLVATLATPATVGAVEFITPDRVVTGGEDGAVRWWDVATAREAQRAKLPGENRAIFSLGVNRATGQVVAVWSDGLTQQAGAHRFAADARPDGSAVPAAGVSGGLVAASPAPDCQSIALADAERIHLVRITPAGDSAVQTTPQPAFAGRLADVSLDGPGDRVFGLGQPRPAPPDGATSPTVVTLFATADLKPVQSIPAPFAVGLAVAPSGESVLTWDDRGGVRFRSLDGKLSRDFKLKTAATSGAVAADGSVAVVAHRDGTATVLGLPR